MPETPEQLYERVTGDLRTPPVETWDAWPFEGPVRPRELKAPLAEEPALAGAGGVDCWACAAGDDEYLWTDERWRVRAIGPTGMPIVLLLETREHHATVAGLPADLVAELGPQLARIDRAIRGLDNIGNVHISRYGDGSEHLHWWFFGRPPRFEQLRMSLISIWDDVLPPVPEEIWREDVERLRAALAD